jgi:hypothetical protein
MGAFLTRSRNSVALAPDARVMSERIEAARVLLPATPAARTPTALGPAASSGPSSFEQVVRRLAREITRGEALVGTAASGRYEGLDAARLIALQAGIYRYSEAIDLTVKLVDRATNGLRTILESGR